MANKEVMQMWADALESDEYRQGSGLLKVKTINGGQELHCCLGVLCELYIKHNPQAEARFELDPIADNKRGHVFRFQSKQTNLEEDTRYTAYLPPEVVEWAGLSDDNPRITVEKYGRVGMVYLNDVVKLDFKQIATIVKQIE